MLLAVLLSSAMYAQQLHFCEQYTDKGEPKNSKDTWSLGDDNSVKVGFLYHNGKTTMDFNKVYFLIEDKANPKMIDEAELRVNPQMNWVATDHYFKRAGEFMVTVYGPGKQALASKLITIVDGAGPTKVTEVTEAKPLKELNKQKETAETKEEGDDNSQPAVTRVKYSKEEVEKVHYYDNSRLMFGDKFTGENLENPRTSFVLGKNGVYVEMLLVTQKPVNAENIMVDVWKKADGGEYTQHVGDKKVATKTGEKLTDFHFSFFDPGEYKVSLFSADNTWICSGYLTVSR